MAVLTRKTTGIVPILHHPYWQQLQQITQFNHGDEIHKRNRAGGRELRNAFHYVTLKPLSDAVIAPYFKVMHGSRLGILGV
jgi:hypothetical protein